jgi:hypothetical protein
MDMKIVLVPKWTNPMTCRFFEPRYAFDLGVLTIGTYVKDKAEVSIKSIFGHIGQKFLNPSDILRLSQKSYLSYFTGYILSERPNVIGFSTMDSSLVNTVVAARAIKERDNNVKIILGGPGVFFNCTFCTTTAFWKNKYRVKSPERLAEEVDHYCRMYPDIHHFDFHSHNNFLKSRAYIRVLGDELDKRKIEISWNCSSRIDLLDDEFIEILAKSGCNYIDCGIESGSARIRRLIKKNIDIDKTLCNTKKLLSKTIGVATNFMFGFPTETLAEMEETFEVACRCDSLNADIVFCFLSPLKGTGIYTRYPDLLVTKLDDRQHDFNDSGVNFLFGAEDLRRENDYFIHQIKMFHNDERYNRIVRKIRAVDSVYLFSQYSDIFLKIKETLKIDIFEIKSALKEVPYSEDLFHFLIKKFREQNIDGQTFIPFINSVLKIQQKTNQNSRAQIEDITLFIWTSRWMSHRQFLDFGKAQVFIEESIQQFFNRTIGLNLYEIFKNIIGISLAAAYWVRERFELILKFRDSKKPDVGILVGLRFNRKGEGQILYYKKNMNTAETNLLNIIVKVVTVKFKTYGKEKNPARIEA